MVSVRFARKWARAASESVAQSAPENRRLLEATRSSSVPFALYLRGFAEEGKALRSLVAMPLSTRRPDKATRWIESEIVEELGRHGQRVFCLSNPSDTFLLPGAIRLEVTPGAWLSEVRTLATEADVIVIYVSATSPGLLAELDLLRRYNLTHKSVVVLARKLHRQGASPAHDFPVQAIAPPGSRLNQSTFGPIAGRLSFRRQLSAGIEKTIEA